MHLLSEIVNRLNKLHFNVCKEVIRKDYPDLSVAQFKRLMFESYLASTIISTCGKSPHLKIIQKINHRLAQLAA